MCPFKEHYGTLSFFSNGEQLGLDLGGIRLDGGLGSGQVHGCV